MKTTTYEYHPIAAMFPLMDSESDERAKMKEDIRIHGQKETIDLYEGQILDGRNRYEICTELGIEPQVSTLPDDEDPVAYVISKNLHRRHLDASQRAMLVLDKWDKYKKDAKTRQGTRSDLQLVGNVAQKSRATEDAAKAAGVSDRTMHDAVVVKEQGSTRLKRDVRSGKVSASAAAKQVRSDAIRALVATLPKTIRDKVDNGAIDPPAAELKRMASLPEGVQGKISDALRMTRAKTLAEAFTQCGITKAPPKKTSPAENIDNDILSKLKALGTTKAELERLSELNPAQQKATVALVTSGKEKTVASAILAVMGDATTPRDKLKQVIPPKLRKHAADGWFAATEKALKQAITDLKVRSGNPFLHPLEPIVEHLQTAATKIGDAAFGIVCPACEGAGKDCGWCRSTGWMPAWAFTDYKAKTNYKGKK